MVGNVAKKFYGQSGVESPRPGGTMPDKMEKGLRPLTKILSSIKTEVSHVSYGSRTPDVNKVDGWGSYARGDHKALSSMFAFDFTLHSIANTTQDLKNFQTSGSCEAQTQRNVEGEPTSSALLAVVTPGGSLRLNTGDYRHAGGEAGSLLLSLSFVNRKPNPTEWNNVKKLVIYLHEAGKKKTVIRGAFLDFDQSRAPMAFQVENNEKPKIEVCGNKESNNAETDINGLLEKMDEAYDKAAEDVSFYLGGTFDI
jgi:hypothetical protein